MTEKNSKPDSFRTQQPLIPGVPARPSRPPQKSVLPSPPAPRSSYRGLGIAIGFAILALTTATFAVRKWGPKAGAALHLKAASAPTAANEPRRRPAPTPLGPGDIATTDELAKPWASKLFLFHNQLTEVTVPATVVHLPGGSYWAFSLVEPYGDCHLQFVADSKRLSDEFGVTADHPMVVDPCNGSVFDLLRYGTGPAGMVRGEIVKGSALRPPVAIEIRVEGQRVIADSME